MKRAINVPLVLAVEPDLRQGALLKRVIGDGVHAELILVETRDAAIAALTARVPDVILLTALLSPRDEDEMVAHLRTLEGADHVQTHTIPQLASGAQGRSEPAAQGTLLGKFRRRKEAQEPIAGCDPALFAEEVRAFLARAAELKAHAAAAPLSRERVKKGAKKRSAAQDGDPVTPAADADADAAAGSAWSSPFEWRKAEPINEPASRTARPSLVTSAPLAVLAEEEEERRTKEAEGERARAEAKAAADRAAADAKAAADATAKRDAERKRLEAEAAAKRDAERKRLEAEAAAKREEERKRLEVEAAAKREAERKRLEAEAAAKREAERKRLEAEAAAKRDAERQRLEAEAAAARERERVRAEAELAARREQERKRLEAEAATARENVRLEAEAAERRDQERVAREQADRAAADRAAAELEPDPDAFADFREDAPNILGLMPLSLWARREESAAADRHAPAARNADDLRELIEGLALPPNVAGVSYARGCRIRRVRVAASGAPPRAKGPVIVSKRALDEIRAGN